MTCPGSESRPGNPDATPVLHPLWPTVWSDPQEAGGSHRRGGEGDGGRAHSAPLSLSSVNTHCLLSPAWHWAGPHGGIGLVDSGVLRPEMAGSSQRKEGLPATAGG